MIMRFSEEEIIKALIVIKEVCAEMKGCSKCPLRANDDCDDGTYCAIQNRPPMDYEIEPISNKARRLIGPCASCGAKEKGPAARER